MHSFSEERSSLRTPHRDVSVEVILKHLAIRKRIELLAALSLRSQRVSDLARALGYDISDVSVHLRELRYAGLVCDRRIKRDHYQSLASPRVVYVKDRT